MKKSNKLICFIAVFLFMLTLVFPLMLSSFIEDEAGNADEDVGEKRSLTAFPTEYSNDYLSKVEDWFEDHSPLRNTIIKLQNAGDVFISDLYDESLKQTLTDWILGTGEINTPSYNETVTTENPDEPTGPVEPDCDHVFGESVVTRETTCSKEGLREATCTICNWTKVEKIDKLSHTNTQIYSAKRTQHSNQYVLYKCDVCGEFTISDFVPITSTKRNLAIQYKSKTGDPLATAIIGLNNWYFYAGDDSELYYTGENMLTDEEMLSWKNSLEALQAACDKRGVTLVVMTAPNREQVYPEWMPTTYVIQNEKKRAQVFYEYMQANSTVKYIYPLEEFLYYKQVVPLYYRQDTHWDNVGGFVGTMLMYEEAGLPTVHLFDLLAAGKVYTNTMRGGDLANFVGKSAEYPDWHVSYKGNINVVPQTFENHVNENKSELTLYHSDANVTRDIVVISDSYRHATSDYIKRDFEYSLFAHKCELPYRTEIVVDRLNALGEGDVLFILSVERFDYQNIEAADEIVKIFAEYDEAHKNDPVTTAEVTTKTPATTKTPETTTSPESQSTPVTTGSPVTTASPVTATPVTTNVAEGTTEPVQNTCKHVFDSGYVLKEATCLETGEKKQTCIICNTTRMVETEKTSHNLTTIKSGTATVDTYGYSLKNCSVCGYYEIVNIQKKLVDSKPLAVEYKSKTNDILATAIIGKNNWYFYAGDESEKYYTGDNILSDAEMKEWKDAFEELQAEIDKRGSQLVILLAPNKEQMYPEYMPTTYNVKTQNKRADVFYEYMKKNSSVKYYYLKDELTEAGYLFDTYYKQDTHWNNVGGFVGTMKFYEAIGFETVSLADLVNNNMIKQTSKKGGDLAGFVGNSTQYTDWSITYKKNVSQTSSKDFANHVTTDTNPNSELQLKTSNAKSGHNLLVIGDSYRHMMEGYLIKDFDAALIAHRTELDYRTQIVMDSLEIIGPNDALLMIAVERFDEEQVEAAKKITAILKEFDEKK